MKTLMQHDVSCLRGLFFKRKDFSQYEMKLALAQLNHIVEGKISADE